MERDGLRLVVDERRLCGQCVFGYIGAGGCFCIAFGEFIDDERAAAADCPLWEPQ
jgi:hypothetical protein